MSAPKILLKILCGAVVCGAVIWGAFGQAGAQTEARKDESARGDPPMQPLPFSHKTHAGTMKLACKMCHPNPEPGVKMTFAPASNCMQCHSAIKADSPAIQKLAAFAKSGAPVPWVRVYEIPTFVIFSHKAHLAKGNTCQECHGAVAERDQLFRETRMTMAGCVDCHKAKKAKTDCDFCHEPLHLP